MPLLNIDGTRATPGAPQPAFQGPYSAQLANPYQGSPQPYQQSPGAQSAQSLNPLLGQYGGSVDQNVPNGLTPAQASLIGSLGTGILGPAELSAGAQTNILTGPGGQQDLTSQQLALNEQLTRQGAATSLAQLGVQGSNLGIQQGQLTAQYGPGGFNAQQQGITSAEQAQQLEQQQRALRSNATVGGSINTSGTQQSWSDLLANAGLQKQQLALQAREQASAGQAAQAQLNNASKSLGISTAEVQSRLTNALAQYGLQGKMDANGFLQAIEQIKAGTVDPALAQIVTTVLQASGLPIQAFAGGG